MESVQIPEVMLNSGRKMPVVGMGTATLPLPSPDCLVPIFVDAIKAGYRHFDTAALYGSEECLGRAVAEALENGLVENRDQLFITSKLWCTDAHPDLVLPALNETLRKLGLEYVDLYLVHWPVRLKKATEPFKKEHILPFDMRGTWEAMQECCRLGLARSIGVSNFSCSKLRQLLKYATIPPAVNQVEINIAWQQKKLIQLCKETGIHASAYTPLGANGSAWGCPAVMQSPILKDIAAARNKNIAQVALRWVYEQGVSIIVKSFNRERMKQNLQIFDWELTTEEVDQIQKIPQQKSFTGHEFVHPDGPYKSLEELWDGDL